MCSILFSGGQSHSYFGSPSPSIVAERGSVPNSPHLNDSGSVQLNGSLSHSSIEPGARISLFQVNFDDFKITKYKSDTFNSK